MSLWPSHPAGPTPPTPLPPPAGSQTVPAVHVEGATLRLADGTETKLVGVSDFAQFARWLQASGKENLVRPILNERTTLAREAGYRGPLTARVFRNAAPPNAFALDPWSYPMAAAREFTQFYNEQGWYVDWTSGDNQICFPLDGDRAQLDGPTGFNQHVNEFTGNLLDLQYVWNTCNEPFKNGFGHQALPVPPPWTSVVRYSGDYADDRDRSRDLACINLHTDRSTDGVVEKWVGKGHESAPYLWPVKKPIFYDEGMGADETNQPGRRSNVPYYFAVQGSQIAVVNAVYFHSTNGIASDGFGPVTRQCYQAFMRGAAAGLRV